MYSTAIRKFFKDIISANGSRADLMVGKCEGNAFQLYGYGTAKANGNPIVLVVILHV